MKFVQECQNAGELVRVGGDFNEVLGLEDANRLGKRTSQKAALFGHVSLHMPVGLNVVRHHRAPAACAKCIVLVDDTRTADAISPFSFAQSHKATTPNAFFSKQFLATS